MKRRTRLVALMIVAGFTAASCADNAAHAPATSPVPPSPSVTTSPPPTAPQQTAVSWASSMCLTLGLAFSHLGKPPQPDFGNPTATREAFGSYLSGTADAAQQAIDQLSALGPPPVENGQRILDQLRIQLTQLRDNLREAATQLKAADTNHVLGYGQAFAAAGNVLALLGTLTSQPELRAAFDHAPVCQSLSTQAPR